VSLRDHDLASNVSANELWRLLRDRPKVGPTIVSKLLAAKRPHLFPIYDSYVADYLLPAEHRARWEWWDPWHRLLTGPDNRHLHTAVQAVRDQASNMRPDLPVEALSELRVLDIVIWMAEERRRKGDAARPNTRR
jgi:Family of unknown function (DUF6308)